VHRHLDHGEIRVQVPLDERDEHYRSAVDERGRSADVASLVPLLRPRSVTVVGASRRPGSVGRTVLEKIRQGGFKCELWAVNPYAERICGEPAYPGLSELPGTPDLAVLAVPPGVVASAAEKCGQAGVRALVVLTSGLSGADAQQLLHSCRRHSMRLVGPNCHAFPSTRTRSQPLMLSPTPATGPPGWPNHPDPNRPSPTAPRKPPKTWWRASWTRMPTAAGSTPPSPQTSSAATACRDFENRFGDRLAGMVVQPMAAPGTELFAGIVQDQVFGPLIVFGLGGTATDLLDDRTARLTPLTENDLHAMTTELRGAPLLFGYHGHPAVDLTAVHDLLARLSRLADDLPQLAEADLNPIIATPDALLCVDARVGLEPRRPFDPYLRQLRHPVED